MTWIDKALDGCTGPVVINDSKTPSGRAHVGSLRGVLIHDALARVARDRSMDATFMYGCDDMDAVDEIPHGTGEYFAEHLGKPLWAAPPPEGLPGASMAEAYFGEFTGQWFDGTDSPDEDADGWFSTPGTFSKLGVKAEFYRMSDIYRSGQLDGIIDTFLRAAADVRQIYLRVSGARRSDDWLPFQPICEQCGRIGTTYATGYDGATVAYECRPDLVAWATGCGHRGRISPFGGNGKLPWKLEWAAKWKLFGVSIEGAGKDHMAASGSHQVSSALARQVLRCPVPVPVPYEFFTLGGAKMSSSKGIGMTASELTQMLPPELLRYTVLRTQPRRAIDFDLKEDSLTKAFVEYERLWRSAVSGDPRQSDNQLYLVSRPVPGANVPSAPEFSPPFDSVLSLTLQPHIDLAAHIATLGVDPSEAETKWLEIKATVARAWASRFPESADALVVTGDAANALSRLTNQQRAFLAVGAGLLGELDEWSAHGIQAALFDAARLVGPDERSAIGNIFEALYEVLFDRPEGPRAGRFLEFYGQQRTVERLGSASYSYADLVQVTALNLDHWDSEIGEAANAGDRVEFLARSVARGDADSGDSASVLEAFITDSQNFLRAVRTLHHEPLLHAAAVLRIDPSDVVVRSQDPFSG